MSENEQLGFCPAIIVPGIYYLDDTGFSASSG